MMISSNGNGSRVIGHSWWESTGRRWFQSQRTSNAAFDVVFDVSLNERLNNQSSRR